MRWVALVPGLFLFLWLSACAPSSPPIPHESPFRGIITLGFETSVFTPCDSDEPSSWLALSKKSNFSARYKNLMKRQPADQQDLPVYAHFVGVQVSGDPNGYGHLGQFTSEITLTKVLSLQLAPDGKCP
jgi:hypothetical protein